MNTVLITGATGFIARHLAAVLQRASLRVIGVARVARPLPGFDTVYGASLTESLGEVWSKEKVDAMVHCAHHFGDDAYAVNVQGTTLWVEEAAAHGVGLQVFLSSLTATENALSDYGQAKYDLEHLFIQANEVVFRLGLVIGDGGLFLRMKKSMQKALLVPLIDGSRSHVYVTGIEVLCDLLAACIRSEGAGLRGTVWHIQQPQPCKLRDVMRGIRKHYGYTCRLVPTPYLPLLALVSLVERIGFPKLPISSVNLKGLRQNGRATFPSDFAHFGYPEQSLDELIGRAAEAEKEEDASS